MADSKQSNNVDAVQALIKTIERMSDIKVRLQQDPNFDFKAMKQREASLAAYEIEQSRKADLKSLIKKIHQSGKIDEKYSFDTIIKDQLNQKAISTAQGFCYALDDATVPMLLIIQGAEGAGKTVLANAIANERLKFSPESVELIYFDELKKSRLFNQSEDREERIERNDRWDRFCNVKLLILDGLCQNHEGLQLFDQKIMAELLRIRHDNGLSMAITTVVPFESLHNSIGTHCFESMKDYSVIAESLLGGSRRNPIRFNGRALA